MRLEWQSLIHGDTAGPLSTSVQLGGCPTGQALLSRLCCTLTLTPRRALTGPGSRDDEPGASS